MKRGCRNRALCEAYLITFYYGAAGQPHHRFWQGMQFLFTTPQEKTLLPDISARAHQCLRADPKSGMDSCPHLHKAAA